MTKQFGIITKNALVEEVLLRDTHKTNRQRTLLLGTIVRIERFLSDDSYSVRCLKDDKENWESAQFNCPSEKCDLVPEKLWQFLAAVESPQERVKVASNKERHERLLLVATDMVVAYTDDHNVLLGTVQFIGKVQSIGFCYGIRLHEKKPGMRCNGSIGNLQYFNCLPGCGIFATIDKLVPHNVLNKSMNTMEYIDTNTPVSTHRHTLGSNKPSTISSKMNAEHSRMSSVTKPSLQDENNDNIKELKPSQLYPSLPKESVNRNHDFDQNSMLQPEKLPLLLKNKFSVALKNGDSYDKIVNTANDSKLTETFLNNTSELNRKVVHQPDSSKTNRNKSINPISHIMNANKINSKKRKDPTFESYVTPDPSEAVKDNIGGNTVQYIEPDAGLTNDISIGMLVQVVSDDCGVHSGDVQYGVVRWLGMEVPLTDGTSQGVTTTRPQTTSPNIMVGIELDDDDSPPDMDLGCTDGTFAGERRFTCTGNTDTQHNAIFVPLAKCRKDRRFTEESNGEAIACTSTGITRAAGGAGGVSSPRATASGSRAGMEERRVYRERDRQFDVDRQKLFEAENGKPVIPGIVPPLTMKTEEDVKAVCTMFRGIQGHHNSCYLDATLFSMFTFTSVFDSLIYREKNKDDIKEYEEVQRVLREEIVNPLRTNLFVNSDRVMTLRQQLDKLSSVSGLTSEEKDPEEFLNSLLAQILRVEPFLKLNSGQESYFYQLFVEKDEKLKLPTVQQLFEQSFHASEIKLKEVPNCLIIQMPRFGKSYKMYPRIIPSKLLDITDIIENSPRGCALCGFLAYYECTSCFASDIHSDGLENTAFCKGCVRSFHHHENRTDHKPRPLTLPPDYQTFVEEGHESPQPPRIYMNLFAVVCIETSHYVAFVKCGTNIDAPWCFFDSMADRKGEKNGFNIPAMVACPDVSKWLSDEKSCDKLHADNPLDRHLPEHARRLLCDAYICMYQNDDVMMYK